MISFVSTSVLFYEWFESIFFFCICLCSFLWTIAWILFAQSYTLVHIDFQIGLRHAVLRCKLAKPQLGSTWNSIWMAVETKKWTWKLGEQWRMLCFGLVCWAKILFSFWCDWFTTWNNSGNIFIAKEELTHFFPPSLKLNKKLCRIFQFYFYLSIQEFTVEATVWSAQNINNRKVRGYIHTYATLRLFCGNIRSP